MAAGTGTITASGSTHGVSLGLDGGSVQDNFCSIQLVGTSSADTFRVQGSQDGGTTWFNIAVIARDSLTVVNGGSDIAVGGASYDQCWSADVRGLNALQVYSQSLTSTSVAVNLSSGYASGGPVLNVATAGSSASFAATTITSASANSLAVGPAGTTNPVFKVDSSTSSQADGLKLTGLAAGSGATLLVITSGTNAPLNINAAGSGNIVMNQAGTGITVFTTGLSITDAKNVTLATTTGTSFGGATTQKLSFYGVTPITQPAASSAVSVTGTTGASTGVSLDTTFTGGGTAAYTIGGLVTKLKALGLLAT